jgi:pimeloyl-ACP methyl ester carboxylesterase
VAAEHRFVTTNGIRMHIAEQGDGPLVLLLHGFPESWYSWRHQFQPLVEAGFRVVAPDQRGYGRTDSPAAIDQFSIMHLVGDVVGLIAALEESSAIVVGHDWGAPVAWATALLRPDLVRGVAGLSVPPGGPLVPVRGERTPPISAFRERFGDSFYMVQFQQPGVAEGLLGGDPRASFRGMLGSASADAGREEPSLDDGHRPASSSLPEWLTEDDIDVFVSEYSERGFAGGLNWYRNIDRNWELLAPWTGALITPPSLLMIGDRDVTRGFLPIPDSLKALRELAPAARDLITVESCGHWTQQERPGVVSDALVEFATSLGVTAGGRVPPGGA